VSRIAFIIWALVAWVTPALVAGALGWNGIWGSGSALGDYLVPFPVAGGMLHVPSFVFAAVLALAWPAIAPGMAGALRGVCIGLALTGAAMLVDLERIHLALTTDIELVRLPLEQNPLALFVLTDALWLLVWSLFSPVAAQGWPVAVLIAVVLPAGYIAVNLAGLRSGEDFVAGARLPGPERGDQRHWIYTSHSPDAAGFREAALAFVETWGPRRNVDSEDVAFYFTDSLTLVKRDPLAADPMLTLCLHEDGTPERWIEGQGDCFSDHETVDERAAEIWREYPHSMPDDVRGYLMLGRLCADFAAATSAAGAAAGATVDHDGIALYYRCSRHRPADRYQQLAAKYAAAELENWGVTAP